MKFTKVIALAAVFAVSANSFAEDVVLPVIEGEQALKLIQTLKAKNPKFDPRKNELGEVSCYPYTAGIGGQYGTVERIRCKITLNGKTTRFTKRPNEQYYPALYAVLQSLPETFVKANDYRLFDLSCKETKTVQKNSVRLSVICHYTPPIN